MTARSFRVRPWSLASVLLLAATAAPSSAAQAWSVDAAGGGDFTGIAEAIASPLVADGDLLFVEPGAYAGFTLDKALQVLAPAGATIDVGHVAVAGVADFALAGLRMHSLDVDSVPGRARVEDCQVGSLQFDDPGGFYWVGWTEITDCTQLALSRSVLRGTEACYPNGPDLAAPALFVERSTVAVVDCTLVGGVGAGGECAVHYPTAGAGLVAVDGSDVTVAATDASGGWGPFDSNEPAIRAAASTVRVRGSASNVLSAFAPTEAVGGDSATATVVVSGVQLTPATLPPWVTVPAVAEPYLRLDGPPLPGQTVGLELYGPAGLVTAVVGQLGAGQVLPPPFGAENLWLDPGALLFVLPLNAVGQDAPALLSLPVPADPILVGLAVTLQAGGAAWLGQGPQVTNPVDLLLRW